MLQQPPLTYTSTSASTCKDKGAAVFIQPRMRLTGRISSDLSGRRTVWRQLVETFSSVGFVKWLAARLLAPAGIHHLQYHPPAPCQPHSQLLFSDFSAPLLRLDSLLTTVLLTFISLGSAWGVASVAPKLSNIYIQNIDNSLKV